MDAPATLWPARATRYRGVQMRSRLEARAAAGLDRRGTPWKYEPMCFANADGQYLPDFELGWQGLIPLNDKCQYFAEVKPPQDHRRRELLGRRMEIIWASIESAGFILIEERRDDPERATIRAWVDSQWYDFCADDLVLGSYS